MLDALIFGLHLASVHLPAKLITTTKTGAYVRHESGWSAGGYRNSIGRDTYYLGYSHDVGQGFSVMAGAGSGYRRECSSSTTHAFDGKKTTTRVQTTCDGFSRGALAPVVGVTWAPPLMRGAKPRLWLVPGFKNSSTTLHLSAEF